MIVKYKKDRAWGYIDNVRQAECKQLDIGALIKDYDENYKLPENDPTEYMESVRLPDSIVKSNKAFTVAWDSVADTSGNRHAENLLNPEEMDFPAVTILIYLENCKEYDSLLLITNQKAYLMNDKGQTIERLV